jgi:hypothetical protein
VETFKALLIIAVTLAHILGLLVEFTTLEQFKAIMGLGLMPSTKMKRLQIK